MVDTLSSLAGGIAAAATPINLLWALLGCFIGTAIGVLPGIGPALTVAMLLPLTAKVEPASALILFAGIYYGAMFGGSTTSILMNTPGESATMVTAMEGNAMAKNGRAGPALATAAIGSFVAGSIATIGANSVTSTVAIVPATKEPIADVASAAPARPLFAILKPSSAVTIVPVSPGVLSRIEVVDPPNIAP